MGETSRPATGVKLPMTFREYGLLVDPDDPTQIVNVGSNLQLAEHLSYAGGAELVWRAVSQWLPIADAH